MFSALTPRTRAIIAVDYAGVPADYGPAAELPTIEGPVLIEDAAHSLGRTLSNPAGRLDRAPDDLLAPPVKVITTGEGGVITTDDEGGRPDAPVSQPWHHRGQRATRGVRIWVYGSRNSGSTTG